MNDRITAGAASLMGALVLGTGLVRWAVTGGRPAKHRARRRPVGEFVPAHVLIPALAHGAVVPTAVAYCRGCRASVPVTVHGNATHCDAGHLTIHTAGASDEPPVRRPA